MARDSKGGTPSPPNRSGSGGTGTEPRGRSGTWWLLGGIALVIALAVIGVAIFSGGDDESTTGSNDSNSSDTASSGLSQFQPVQVEGTLDPISGSGVSDDGGGATAPVATVHSFDGTEITLPVPGKPTMIAFGAHWCPHCQKTFPVIVDWLNGGGGKGIEAVAVATGTDDSAPNYPPSEWFTAIGWPGTEVADDEQSTLAQAYGLKSYPYILFVDADGKVRYRLRGEVGPDELDKGAATITR